MKFLILILSMIIFISCSEDNLMMNDENDNLKAASDTATTIISLSVNIINLFPVYYYCNDTIAKISAIRDNDTITFQRDSTMLIKVWFANIYSEVDSLEIYQIDFNVYDKKTTQLTNVKELMELPREIIQIF